MSESIFDQIADGHTDLVFDYVATGQRRLNKGIPPNNPQRKPWRPEDDKVLGTRPDDQIAMLLGRTITAVKDRSKKLGVTPRKMPRPLAR